VQLINDKGIGKKCQLAGCGSFEFGIGNAECGIKKGLKSYLISLILNPTWLVCLHFETHRDAPLIIKIDAESGFAW
jgi:hypothetical protein